MDREEAYAAIVIPADFSHKLASLLSPQPQPSAVTLYVNQGMNNTAATMANGVLTQMLNGVNGQLREKLLTQASQKGGTLTIDQTKALATPVVVTSKNINAIGTHSANGNAPVVLTQLAWFGAMVTTILLYLAAGKATQTGSRMHRFRHSGVPDFKWSCDYSSIGGKYSPCSRSMARSRDSGSRQNFLIPVPSRDLLSSFYKRQLSVGSDLKVSRFSFSSSSSVHRYCRCHQNYYLASVMIGCMRGCRFVSLRKDCAICSISAKDLNLSSPIWTLALIGAGALVVILLSLLKKHEQPAAQAVSA